MNGNEGVGYLRGGLRHGVLKTYFEKGKERRGEVMVNGEGEIGEKENGGNDKASGFEAREKREEG